MLVEIVVELVLDHGFLLEIIDPNQVVPAYCYYLLVVGIGCDNEVIQVVRIVTRQTLFNFW